MMIDADGVERVNLEWSIEGKDGKVKSGTLYELHEGEVATSKAAIKRQARRGDTVTITAI